MKCTIFPWLANEDTWWSGIGIRSLSPKVETVRVIWTGVSSQPTIPTHYKISPYSELKLEIPKPYKNVAALVVGPDSTYAVASTGLGQTGYGFAPAFEAKTFGDLLQFYSPAPMTEWISNPYITWLGANFGKLSSYTVTPQRVALELAAMKVFYEFPDRTDRSLGVIDGCLKAGQTTGHPIGAHTSPPTQDVDCSYYTFGINNTQYPPNPTIIWDGNTLTGNFDKERNARFLAIAYGYLPDMMVQVDTRIATALGNPKYVQGDMVPDYNHNRHMHIDTGNWVNLEAMIQ